MECIDCGSGVDPRDKYCRNCGSQLKIADRFVFGVDLDGVCAEFIQGLRPIAAEWLDVPVESLTAEPSYGFKEWGLDEQYLKYEDLHQFAVTQRDLFAKLPPIIGAAPSLRRLSKDGVRIRIITHRIFIPNFHEKAVAQTVEWLDKYGFPYWDLCFMKDKTAVGADLYIDDSETNIKALRGEGLHVIVFRNSTNRDLDGPAAETWDEVETLVRERLPKEH